MKFESLQKVYKVVKYPPNDYFVLEALVLKESNILIYKDENGRYRTADINNVNGSFGEESSWESTKKKAIKSHRRLIHKEYKKQLDKLKELK